MKKVSYRIVYKLRFYFFCKYLNNGILVNLGLEIDLEGYIFKLIVIIFTEVGIMRNFFFVYFCIYKYFFYYLNI